MDFAKVEEFIRAHWPAAVMVAILVVPPTWGIANMHYSERLTILDTKLGVLSKEVMTLQERVAVLDQAAARKLESNEARFTYAELFTPSPTTSTGKP